MFIFENIKITKMYSQFKIVIFWGLLAFGILFSIAACSSKFDKENIEVIVDDPDTEPVPMVFVHPGILHNDDDLNRIKNIVDQKTQPGYGSYEELIKQVTASSNYQIKGPFERIARDGEDGYTKSLYESDFKAAYHNAIMWVITGNETHAKKAIEIINAYSNKLIAITGTNDNNLTASLGSFVLVNAAEILRYKYSGWTTEETTKCETMFNNVFAAELRKFYSRPAYTNGNWGTATIKAMLGISVFLDNEDYFKEALRLFYSKGLDNGSLANYIINEAGQCQESGRDQGHVMFGIGSLAEACEIGYHQNIDMYGALENRLLKGYEYTAKYNIGLGVPFVQWTDVTGKYSNWTQISDSKRGEFRSVFEIAYNAYVVRKELKMPYTEIILNSIRPEGKPFGIDNPGFGSLLFLTQN